MPGSTPRAPAAATTRRGGRPDRAPATGGMTKAFSLIIVLAMGIQLIRPLGFPGLKRRADAWKLAIAALAAIMLVAVTKGE